MNKHKDIDPYDEEVWEDEVITDKSTGIYLTLDDLNCEVDMDMNFHQFIMNRYGLRMPMREGNKMITFKNPFDKDLFMSKFTSERDYFGKKIDTIKIEKVDKKGDVKINVTLHGIRLLGYSGYDSRVEICYDYFEINYI